MSACGLWIQLASEDRLDDDAPPVIDLEAIREHSAQRAATQVAVLRDGAVRRYAVVRDRRSGRAIIR